MSRPAGGLLLDVLARGRREEGRKFGEGAVGDDATLVQDRDPVGELLGLLEVLRGQQHRGARFGELLDGLPDLNAGLRVQPGRGFVQEEDWRVTDQAHRDVESAPHSAGVGRGLPVRRVGQGEPGEQPISDVLGLRDVTQLGDQHEVLPPRERLINGGELPGQADRLPHPRGFPGHVDAVDGRRPAVRCEQRGEDPDHGGLACAVGAEQGHDVADGDVEVDTVQDVLVAEGLGETADLDGWLCGHAESVEP